MSPTSHGQRILIVVGALVACGRVSLDPPASGAAGTTAVAGGAGAAGTAPDTSGVACGKVHCAAKQVCCILNANCIDPATAALTCPKPSAPPKPSVPGARACGSNADCGTNEFCGTDDITCLGPGICQDRSNCGTSGGAPFCGCDGVTYPNVQTACRAGITTGARVGACGTVSRPGDADHDSVVYCGRDDQCPAGLICCAIYGKCVDPALPVLCTPPPASTRSACASDRQCDPMFEFCQGPGCSGPGGCVSVGGLCNGVLEPVCGCDGKTYTNESCTLAIPTRTAHAGACAPP